MKFWEAMKALEEGQDVEHRIEGWGWRTTAPTGTFRMSWEYRLKPKPKIWEVIKHWEGGGRIQERRLHLGHSDWESPRGGFMSISIKGEQDYEYRIHPDEVNDE